MVLQLSNSGIYQHRYNMIMTGSTCLILKVQHCVSQTIQYYLFSNVYSPVYTIRHEVPFGSRLWGQRVSWEEDPQMCLSMFASGLGREMNLSTNRRV